MNEFDDIAADYDATRGGEARGDDYAADIDARLPVGEGPVLEIGVGTGVVALGLRRRGRRVVGVDISALMLARALTRLGPVLVRSDATRMALRSDSVAHATSVWVVHAVADPVALFAEAARVVRPGGRYVVCSAQRAGADDAIGQVIAAMAVRVDELRGTERPRGVSTEEVAAWAIAGGFEVLGLEHLERQWRGSTTDEIVAIERRAWPAMRDLGEDALESAVRPALEALAAMPSGEVARRGVADLFILRRP